MYLYIIVPVGLPGHSQQRTQFPGDARPLTQEPITLMLHSNYYL